MMDQSNETDRLSDGDSAVTIAPGEPHPDAPKPIPVEPDGGIGDGAGPPEPVGVRLLNTRIEEGDDGRSEMLFRLIDDGAVEGDRYFDFYTVDGSATAGEDYREARGQVMIPAGEESITIPVTVLGDSAVERIETVELVVTHADPDGGPVIAIAYTAKGFIIDDDADNRFLGPPEQEPIRILPVDPEDTELRGSDGLDRAVLGGSAAAVSVRIEGGTIEIETGDRTVSLADVERVEFDDGVLAFDAGPASVYRLYQAALGREPDAGGLGYWVGRNDEGASLSELAHAFLESAEFQTRFGADLDNTAFIERLYDNVLGRAAEPAGLLYWSDVLEQGADRADILTELTNSAENIARTAAATDDGVWLG